MELGGPSSPSAVERLASGEAGLASAFSSLTTTTTQLGQGLAPASLPGLPKRPLGLQRQAQEGGLHEGALMQPWAKRRCVSAEDLQSYQAQLRGGGQDGACPPPNGARFTATPAAVRPSLSNWQRPLHRYNLRSGNGSGLGAGPEHAAAVRNPFQPAGFPPAAVPTAADRGHLLSVTAGGDLRHLVPVQGSSFGQPGLPAARMQPLQLRVPQTFARALPPRHLPPRHPGPAAGRPAAASAQVATGEEQQLLQAQRPGARAAPAVVAAVAAAGAAAAAAEAVVAAASVLQGAFRLDPMLQEPAVAQQGYAQLPAPAPPAATWLGAAPGSAPKTVPAHGALAFPAYPAPAVMSSTAHVAFSDSQEAEWESHAFSEGSPDSSSNGDFEVLDDGTSPGSDEQDWDVCGQDGFHSARSHPSVLHEMPPEQGHQTGQQQRQVSFKTAADSAHAPQHRARQWEQELMLHAELQAANEALCTVPFPENCVFWPVHEADSMIDLCLGHNIPPVSIVLGATYFQRLLARSADMARQARREGFFVQVPTPGPDGKVVPLVMMRCPSTACDSLRLVYLACIYLGAKVGDRVRYTGQLSAMMKAVAHQPVTPQLAVELEMKVLKGLEWRLGPFFDLGPDGGF